MINNTVVVIIIMQNISKVSSEFFYFFIYHIYPPFTRKRIVSLCFGRLSALAWELLFPRCEGHLSSTERGRRPVRCLAQEHNTRTCRLVLHSLPKMPSAKQGSYRYHFLKVFWYGSTRGMHPRCTCEADALNMLLWQC